MRNKVLILFAIILIIIVSFVILNYNNGLKKFEKEVSNISLPSSIKIISTKSKIGDSGGNGNQSTYRVVSLIKTDMSLDELKKEFDDKNLTFSTHILNSDTPICYITKYESNVFKSNRNFELVFEEINDKENINEYYYLEFIK